MKPNSIGTGISLSLCNHIIRGGVGGGSAPGIGCYYNFIIIFIPDQTKNFDNAFDGSDYSPSAMAVAFYSGFWAYSGW